MKYTDESLAVNKNENITKFCIYRNTGPTGYKYRTRSQVQS